MTEQITARLHLEGSELEADDISITSTVADEDPEDGRFSVVKILAEDISADGLYYLLQWDGYPITAATWEPREHIESMKLVADWEIEKQRQINGIAEPFDLNGWTAAVEAEKAAQNERRRRRREKRKHLGILVSQSVSEHDSELDSSSLDISLDVTEGEKRRESAPEPASKPLRSKDALQRGSIEMDGEDEIMQNRGSEEDESSKVPRQRNRDKESYSSDEVGLSDDSLVMELKANTKRKEERATRRGIEDETSQPSVVNRKLKLGRKENPTEKQSNTLSMFSSELPKSVTSPAKGPITFPSESNPRIEAPSKTGYTGTANRKIERAVDGAAGRGRSVVRGAGAIRGSLRGSLFKSRFSTGAPIKKRKNLQAALLDPPKNSSHFKTPSMRRKAELAGRNMADRAPDFDSIGPLYAPGQFKIRKRQSMSHSHSEIESSQLPDLDKESSANGIEKNAGALQLPDASILADDSQSLFEEPVESVSTEAASTKEQKKKALMEQIAVLDTANRAARAKIANTILHSNDPQWFLKHAPTESRSYEQDVFDSSNNDDSAPSQFLDERLGSSASSTVRDQPAHKSVLPYNDLPVVLQPTPAERSRPVQRMSMDAYKARNTTKSLLENGIQIGVVFGNPESEPLQLILTDVGKSSRNPVIQAVLKLKNIEFGLTCLAADFQCHTKVLAHQVFAAGNIFETGNGNGEVDSIAENLKYSVSGLIYSHPSFSLLLYPSKCEEWKFLQPKDTLGSGDTALLKYKVFGPMTQIAGYLPQSINADSITAMDSRAALLEKLNNDILGLNYQKLMPPTLRHGQKVKSFFFIFPSKAQSLLNYISTWLLACNPERQIFTSQQDWSWTAFTELASESGGVIIIHESLTSIVSKIPNLMQVLQTSTIWKANESDGVGERFSRLFPYGGAIFLTPSFLYWEPKRTYQILKWFRQKVESSPFWTWKLLGCFGLRQYLYDLAIEMASQRQHLSSDTSMDDDQKKLVAVSQGLTFEECDDRFLSCVVVDEMLPDDVMTGFPYFGYEDNPDEDLSPILYATDEIDQDDERGLAEWFAYWSISHLTDFRKFVILGTNHSKIRAQRKSAIVTTVTSGQGIEKLKIAVDQQEVKHISQGVSSNESKFKDSSDLQPQSQRPRESAVLDVTNSKKTSLAKSLPTRIDETIPPEILEFIVITASDTVTAQHYLSKANNSVPQATKMFFSETQSTGLDGATDSPFVDLITGPEAVHRSRVVQSDLQRAIELFQSPPPPAPTPSPFSFAWPKRPNGTEERKTHPRENNKDAGKAAPASGRTLMAQPREEREIVGSRESQTPLIAGEDGSRSARGIEEKKFKWDAEPTTEWYARLRAEGGGWEHIEVVGWEVGFKSLGVMD